MNVFYAKNFIGMLKKLPRHIQGLYIAQENILKKNWQDPRLHLKKLKGKPTTFSFRVTSSYRAFFYFRTADEIILFVIGHRKDIYR